jgi:hypothetical protein
MPYSNYSCFASGFQERVMLVMDIEECAKIGEEMGAGVAFIHPKATDGVLIELDQQIYSERIPRRGLISLIYLECAEVIAS